MVEHLEKNGGEVVTPVVARQPRREKRREKREGIGVAFGLFSISFLWSL